MASLTEIVSWCDQTLEKSLFSDYCPNGLQVEGCPEVSRIIAGVTACQALLDEAVAREADLVLVHHGYFWKGESSALTGMRRQRIKTLLSHDISLLAYHLPLDAHPQLGNNAMLADRLGIAVQSHFGKQDLACAGELETALSPEEMRQRISQAVNREVLHVGHGPEQIKTLGWCTGAAQSYLESASELGLDAFISGEISENTVHIAREQGIHYFAAGHHATERFGVQALGARLADRFQLSYEFVDIDNPA
ncbi:MAG: Nif3-like dinuclear metal center hexameric protein [Gammaproteobacteria bacterium]